MKDGRREGYTRALSTLPYSAVYVRYISKEGSVEDRRFESADMTFLRWSIVEAFQLPHLRRSPLTPRPGVAASSGRVRCQMNNHLSYRSPSVCTSDSACSTCS